MIQAAASECGLGSISPITRNPKHQITPSRPRRKTSRRDLGADVHATCSTPERIQPENQNNSYSPSDTFPYSQENCPEVVWDYTSPKLPKGAKKRELKITVDEFLKNLTHHQAPECNTQASHYIKLLERWMTKQNTPVCVKKPLRNVKRDSRMRSRQIYEDIKKLVTSIQQKKEEITEGDGKEDSDNGISDVQKSVNVSTTVTPAKPSTSLNKNSFLDGDTNDNDSIEELWGETDNSFIIKATQHLDVSSSKYVAQNKDFDIVSTIPETGTSTCLGNKHTTLEEGLSTEKSSLNKAVLDSDYQAQFLLTQIISCDWESDSEIEDFENGFIMGDEALSLIPDEILCGGDTQTEMKETASQSVAEMSSDKDVLKSDKKLMVTSSENKIEMNEKYSCELSFGNSEGNAEAVNQSEIELFNNFEDESFGDESILCKPEVLSWIDEVESKLSQSQKCTPEEIEKKKDEAIQRRKKNLSKT